MAEISLWMLLEKNIMKPALKHSWLYFASLSGFFTIVCLSFLYDRSSPATGIWWSRINMFLTSPDPERNDSTVFLKAPVPFSMNDHTENFLSIHAVKYSSRRSLTSFGLKLWRSNLVCNGTIMASSSFRHRNTVAATYRMNQNGWWCCWKTSSGIRLATKVCWSPVFDAVVTICIVPIVSIAKPVVRSASRCIYKFHLFTMKSNSSGKIASTLIFNFITR